MIGLAYLRIKIKGNADDGRHARHEIRRLLTAVRRMRAAAVTYTDPALCQKIATDLSRSQLTLEAITGHRAHVRSETRSCLLVMGFLRGRTYRSMERFTQSYPDWGTDGDPDDRGRMTDIVKDYVSPDQHTDVLQKFAQWRDAANADLRLEFQIRAKEPPKPRLRRRRIMDQLVRQAAQAQRLPVSVILRNARISPEQWNDLVIGAVPFTDFVAHDLGAVIGIDAMALLNIESAYQDIPPIKTASQRNRERLARREARLSV